MLVELQLGADLAWTLDFDTDEQAIDAAVQIVRATVRELAAVDFANEGAGPLPADGGLDAALQTRLTLRGHDHASILLD